MATEEIRLVLIGKTGSGKSATGNTILGVNNAFVSKLCGESVTKRCKYATNFNCRKKISIVDTPGLYDTGMTMEKVTGEIKHCVGMSAPGPHAIILVTRIGRFTPEERRTVEHFVERFGEGMYRYLIMLFTVADELEREGVSLEDYIRGCPPALKEMLHLAGNKVLAFNNRLTSNDQVEKLLTLVNSTVAANGGGHYTNNMYLEAEAALKAKEEELRLEAERKNQEMMAKVRDECKEDMEKVIAALQAQHEAAMSRMRDELRAAIAAAADRGGSCNIL